MVESYRYSQREPAIHLLRSGRTPKQVATQLGRALSWVYKWRKRFGDTQDWSRLQAQSRAARSSSRRLPEAVVQAIARTLYIRLIWRYILSGMTLLRLWQDLFS